jgi:hypothetical protein
MVDRRALMRAYGVNKRACVCTCGVNSRALEARLMGAKLNFFGDFNVFLWSR